MNNQMEQTDHNYSNFSCNNNQQQHQSIGMDDIKKKTQGFRKDIRREQLDHYFKTKRKILFQTPAKKTLLNCLEAIQTNINPLENICSLVNLLALKKPFQQYSNQQIEITEKIIQNFCTRMVKVLLHKIIPSLAVPVHRIYCINAISNLFADQLCPNVRYVQIVVQAIDTIYGDLKIWGTDDEIIEVYYMISNLMRKKITSALPLHIQKLLSWVENGVPQIPSDPLKCLTEGTRQLFTNIDETYNPHQNYLFTQNLIQKRQLTLYLLMKRLINDSNISKQQKNNLSLDSQNLYGLFKLFNQNKHYLLKIFCQLENDQEDKKLRQLFISKIIKIFYQHNLKKDNVNQIGHFFITFLQFYPDDNPNYSNEIDIDKPQNEYFQEAKKLNPIISKIHNFLLQKKRLHDLFICLSQLNIDCKRVFLKVICNLLESVDLSLENPTQKNIEMCFEYVLTENHLGNLLVDLISDIGGRLKDEEILKSILQIYQLTIRAQSFKVGMKLRTAFKNLLSEEASFINKERSEGIQSLLKFHDNHGPNQLYEL